MWSSGSYETPKILELSGIGDPKLLRKIGVRPIVDLPGVGENLQVRVTPSCPSSSPIPQVGPSSRSVLIRNEARNHHWRQLVGSRFRQEGNGDLVSAASSRGDGPSLNWVCIANREGVDSTRLSIQHFQLFLSVRLSPRRQRRRSSMPAFETYRDSIQGSRPVSKLCLICRSNGITTIGMVSLS